MEHDIYNAIDEFEFNGTIEDWLDNEYGYDLDKLEDYDDILIGGEDV